MDVPLGSGPNCGEGVTAPKWTRDLLPVDDGGLAGMWIGDFPVVGLNGGLAELKSMFRRMDFLECTVDIASCS